MSMNTQVATESSSVGAIDSLVNLSKTYGGGVAYQVILAVAGSMDSVQDMVQYYTHQVMNFVKMGENLQDVMKEQVEETPSSNSDYEETILQGEQNQTALTFISNGVTAVSAHINQASYLMKGLKNLGNAVTRMYDITTKVS